MNYLSGFLELNWKDSVKGLFVAVVSGAITALLQVIQSGGLELGHAQLSMIVTTAVVSGLSYLIKQLGTDENGKLGGKI